MYAVVETGGKQYKVSPGKQIKVEKLASDEGSSVELDKVLFFSDGKKSLVGTPCLDKAKVIAKIVENGKSEKVVIYKYLAKKDHRKKQGHRQPYSLLEIESLEIDGKSYKIEEEKPKKKAPAKKTAAKKDPKEEKEAVKAEDTKEDIKKEEEKKEV